MFLASLFALLESEEETPDPIAAARKRHCRRAVESIKQADAIFALRGAKWAPAKYWAEFRNRYASVVGSSVGSPWSPPWAPPSATSAAAGTSPVEDEPAPLFISAESLPYSITPQDVAPSDKQWWEVQGW